jgi:ribosome-associated protein
MDRIFQIVKNGPDIALKSLSVTDAETKDEAFRLDQFLKHSAVVGSGGEAKYLIQNGEVKVNGEVETRRRRKLAAGDVIEFRGKSIPVP